MSSKVKIRLTELLVARGLVANVEEATRLVIAGEVLGASAVLTQPQLLLDPHCEIRLRTSGTYVSRGGDKLAGALADFSFDPRGLRCLDVGASTGGFTDCLLRRGVASVVAVDVAYGQFAWSLRTDERVTVFERTNIREVNPANVGAPFDLLVADVSFTPLRTLFEVLASFLTQTGTLIALVKPQFELTGAEADKVDRGGKGDKGDKGGVVIDPHAHIHALEMAVEAAHACGLAPQALTFSPLKGPKGNIEFFLLAQRVGIPATIDIAGVVEHAHERLG